MEERTGRCMCGTVQLTATGAPKRVGICHCVTCRRNTGSAFGLFAIYDEAQVAITGETGSYRSSEEGRRHFCRECGSPLFSRWADGDLDVYVGALDKADDLIPGYELWTARKLDWLRHLPALQQFEHDRDGREPA